MSTVSTGWKRRAATGAAILAISSLPALATFTGFSRALTKKRFRSAALIARDVFDKRDRQLAQLRREESRCDSMELHSRHILDSDHPGYALSREARQACIGRVDIARRMAIDEAEAKVSRLVLDATRGITGSVGLIELVFETSARYGSGAGTDAWIAAWGLKHGFLGYAEGLARVLD